MRRLRAGQALRCGRNPPELPQSPVAALGGQRKILAGWRSRFGAESRFRGPRDPGLRCRKRADVSRAMATAGSSKDVAGPSYAGGGRIGGLGRRGRADPRSGGAGARPAQHQVSDLGIVTETRARKQPPAARRPCRQGAQRRMGSAESAGTPRRRRARYFAAQARMARPKRAKCAKAGCEGDRRPPRALCARRGRDLALG